MGKLGIRVVHLCEILADSNSVCTFEIIAIRFCCYHIPHFCCDARILMYFAFAVSCEGAYDGCRDFERPKYGVLNVHNDYRGVVRAKQYGHLVLI